MREFLRIVHAALPARSAGLFARISFLAMGGALASACSMPVPGLSLDEGPTGAIKSPVTSPFSAEMDGEDWRRAKSALDTALDPQGNGAKVAWDNPQSGAKGAFIPLAQPYPKDDGICRAFTARIETKGRDARSLRSSACRRNGGDWIVGKITPVSDKGETLAGRAENLAERDTGTHLN